MWVKESGTSLLPYSLTFTHCFFDKNFVPTKRQSYHTFPPPLWCWHENTRMLCNMLFFTKTTTHIQSGPNNCTFVEYLLLQCNKNSTDKQNWKNVMLSVNLVPVRFSRGLKFPHSMTFLLFSISMWLYHKISVSFTFNK